MAKFGESVAPYWPKIDGRRREFLVISEPESWYSHWEPGLGRARRCGGPQCMLCARGFQKQLRVVIMAVDSHGRDSLIELRERHREALDAWESTVGLRIELRRSGTARNSPIDLKVVGQSHAAERSIGPLVRTFGLDPIVGGEEIEITPEILRSLNELDSTSELERDA